MQLVRLGIWFRDALSAASDVRAWLAVFVACLPVYLFTAHYTFVSPDTGDAVLPAWQLVHHGNVWLEQLRPHLVWTVPGAGDHLASNRMPGLELVNVPFVALLYWLGPSWIPGALTAATLTASTAGFIFLVFRRLATMRMALAAAAVMAFGTSLWSVASTEVFPHTVDAFCLALAMYALSRERHLLAGVALGIAVVARPHMAVVALVVGLGLGVSNRSWRNLLAIGVPASIGLGLVVGWNTLVFGEPSIGGGYASYVTSNLTNSSPTNGGGISLVTNLLGFLFAPNRGLFLFLPLAGLLLFGMRRAWRNAALWVRLIAVAGVAYSLVQLKINRFDGGVTFYGYRLATELVVCAAPLGLLAVTSWVTEWEWRRRLARSLAGISVGLQAVGAVAFNARYTHAVDPWRESGIRVALIARPLPASILLLSTAVISVWLLQKRPAGREVVRRLLGGRAAAVTVSA